MSSKYIPEKKKRFISKSEQKRLLTKLQMKYGAQLEAMQHKIKSDMEVYGYIHPDTEAQRELLNERIKAEEKHYL